MFGTGSFEQHTSSGPLRRARPRVRVAVGPQQAGSPPPRRVSLSIGDVGRFVDACWRLGNESDLPRIGEVLTGLVVGWYDIGCVLTLIEGDRLRCAVAAHPDPARRAALEQALDERSAPLDGARDLLERRLTVVADDVSTLPLPEPYGHIAAVLGARAALLVPIAGAERLHGALLLYAEAPNGLRHVERRLVEMLSRTAGHAFDGARRLRAEQRQRRRGEAMLAVLRARAGGDALDDLLLLALREVVDASPAEVAALFLHDEEIPENRRLFQHGDDDQLLVSNTVAAALSWRECPVERRMVETRTPQFVSADVDWVVERPGSPATYPECVIVPVMVEARVLGALYLYSHGPEPFTTDDTDFAAELMAPLAGDIERRWSSEQRQPPVNDDGQTQGLARRLSLASSPSEIADIAVRECAAVFGSGKASLYLVETGAGRLALAASVGLPITFVRQVRYVGLGTGPPGAAAEERTLIMSEDLTTDARWPHFGSVAARHGKAHAMWAAPLIADDGDLLGALAVHHDCRRAPTADDTARLTAIAQQVSLALRREILGDRARELYHTTLRTLVAAVDAKDPTAQGHSAQVAAYSRKIAQALELPADEVERIELAGLLHDVGKIGVPARMLQKADRLDPAEWAVIQRHAEIGADILAEHPLLAPIVPMVRHHHERYDGQGYPGRLAGDAIPLGAAIVGLAETFETMTADRVYRAALPVDVAISEIMQASGSQFCPRVVAAFLRTLESKELGTVRVTPRSAATGARPVSGFEARAFTLLQRISAELSALVDIGRFLRRLRGLLEAEFADSACDVFFVDAELRDLVNIAPSWAKSDADRLYIIKEGRGIVGWVAEHGIAANVSDVLLDERYLVPPNDAPMRSEIALPLLVDGRCRGVLNLESPRPAAYSITDQQVLEMVATYVAQAIEVANLHDRLKQQATLDPMTRLYNHRTFYERLERELERAARDGSPLAVVILDADGLKAINDSAGHLAGDAAIRTLAQLLTAHVLPGETLARYGGDEFAIVAPGGSLAELEKRLRAVDRALAGQRASTPLPTLSWGIAAFPDDGRRATELVAHADAAMYARKRQRRGTATLVPSPTA